jgi:hypothetical protein
MDRRTRFAFAANLQYSARVIRRVRSIERRSDAGFGGLPILGFMDLLYFNKCPPFKRICDDANFSSDTPRRFGHLRASKRGARRVNG